MIEVIKKELFRVFGDKKLIFSMFILPAILVIGIYSLMGTVMSSMNKDIDEHKSTVYIQDAPEGIAELMAAVGYADGAEITYVKSGDEIQTIRDQILEGEADLLVIFDADFAQKFAAYENAGDAIPNVKLCYNSTQNYSSAAASKFSAMVLGSLQTQLLQARFNDLNKLNVFETSEELIVKEDSEKGQFLATLLPYLITFMLFSSAMGLCMDAIAGEKERGTLAAMLIAPVKRSEIIFGKIISLSILAVISSAIYAVSMIFAMPMMMKGMGAGDSASVFAGASFSAVQVLGLFAVMASLVFIYVSLLCFISAFAKNIKEAQTFVMPVYMVVLVAGMMTMFRQGMSTPLSAYAIPVYGSALSIQALMTNQLSLAQFGLSVGSNIIISLIFVVLVVKAFNSEKIMLNA